MSVGRDGCAVRRSAAGDVHISVGRDGRAVRRSAAGDEHTSVAIDGCVVRHPTAGDVHFSVVIDGCAVRNTSVRDMHITSGFKRYVDCSFTIKDIHCFAGNDRIGKNLIGVDRFVGDFGENRIVRIRRKCMFTVEHRICFSSIISEFQSNVFCTYSGYLNRTAFSCKCQGRFIPSTCDSCCKPQCDRSIFQLRNSIVAPIFSKDKDILSAAAMKRVVIKSADDDIVICCPGNTVFSTAAEEFIFSRIRPNNIISGAAMDRNSIAGIFQSFAGHINDIIACAGIDFIDPGQAGILSISCEQIVHKNSISICIICQKQDICIGRTFKDFRDLIFAREINDFPCTFPPPRDSLMHCGITIFPFGRILHKKDVKVSIGDGNEMIGFVFHDCGDDWFFNDVVAVTIPHLIIGIGKVIKIHSVAVAFDDHAVVEIIFGDFHSATGLSEGSGRTENCEVCPIHFLPIDHSITVIFKGIVIKSMGIGNTFRQSVFHGVRETGSDGIRLIICSHVGLTIFSGRPAQEHIFFQRKIFQHSPGITLTHQIGLISGRNSCSIFCKIGILDHAIPATEIISTVGGFCPMIKRIEKKMVVAVCNGRNLRKDRLQIFFCCRKNRGGCRVTHIRIFVQRVVNSAIKPICIKNIDFLRIDIVLGSDQIIDLFYILIIIRAICLCIITTGKEYDIIVFPTDVFCKFWFNNAHFCASQRDIVHIIPVRNHFRSLHFIQ